MHEILSTLKKTKRKINIISIEKYKNLFEKPDFEQDNYSRTATGIYKTGHDSIRLMKWLAYYDRSHYQIVGHYDFMESVLKKLNETS